MPLRHYLPLLVFFCGFQGWILSFPLYGPLLFPFSAMHGANPQDAAQMFLFFLSVSYITWGVILAKWRPDSARLKQLLYLSMGGSLLSSLSLFFVPGSLWPIVFALMGLLGALPPCIWISYITFQVPLEKKGWILGITGLYIEAILHILNGPIQSLELISKFFAVHSLLLFSTLIIFRYSSRLDLPQKLEKRDILFPFRWWPLLLFIYIVFLVGGIMYEVVHPILSDYADILSYVGNLPYALTMPVVGIVADRLGSRPVAFFGTVLLGLSYVIFAASPAAFGVIWGNVLIKIGFAFLDLFVLYSLAMLALRYRFLGFIGIGIGVYIFSIFSGSRIHEILRPLINESHFAVYLVAIMILFISFLLIEWIGHRDKSMADREQEEEMQLAKKIQENMLPDPNRFPSMLKIEANIQVAREVGGDFYDVIPIDSRRTLFVIGDVMGKGLPAAMIVSSITSQIRSEIQYGRSLVELLQHVNRTLIRDSRYALYVTAGLALLDIERKTISYASAGHPFPYLIRDGKLSQIGLPSLPLGIDEEEHYEAVISPFKEEDMLVLYTDGLVETRNERNILYGFDQFEQRLMEAASSGERDFSHFLLADVNAHRGNEDFEDDLTLLIIQMNPAAVRGS